MARCPFLYSGKHGVGTRYGAEYEVGFKSVDVIGQA